MLKALGITFLIILALVVGWHIAFILLGGVIAVTASAWGLIVASIIVFCAAILLLFVAAGIGVVLLGIFLAGWTCMAILLFPILFPILLPLFILFLFICMFRPKHKRLTK